MCFYSHHRVSVCIEMLLLWVAEVNIIILYIYDSMIIIKFRINSIKGTKSKTRISLLACVSLSEVCDSAAAEHV